MKIKTAELKDGALDWAVATIKSFEHSIIGKMVRYYPKHARDGMWRFYSPSTDWSQGGPIIEREKIATREVPGEGWFAERSGYDGQGLTPLVAAMRCFVASKLGDEVDVPEELV